jgi:hypothetical protein
VQPLSVPKTKRDDENAQILQMMKRAGVPETSLSTTLVGLGLPFLRDYILDNPKKGVVFFFVSDPPRPGTEMDMECNLAAARLAFSTFAKELILARQSTYICDATFAAEKLASRNSDDEQYTRLTESKHLLLRGFCRYGSLAPFTPRESNILEDCVGLRPEENKLTHFFVEAKSVQDTLQNVKQWYSHAFAEWMFADCLQVWIRRK